MLFINHSCEPNVGFAGNTVLVAMRDISPGEELTTDYALFDDYDGIGEHAREAGQPCPLLLAGEQRGHVERCPPARGVVDIRDQRDVTRARQPVAHLPERLPRSARVGKDQHARP